MDRFKAASSAESSRGGTPVNSRFTSQAATAEDLIKEQTVGLVHLDDFRKRRAEALERKEREGSTATSGATTPLDGVSPAQPAFKKRKKVVNKGKLSFGADDDEDAGLSAPPTPTPLGNTSAKSSAVNSEDETRAFKKKLGANTNVGVKPRVMTKSALAREAQQTDEARREFLARRDAVKATDISIPFVFYDGTNTPGGRCRVKKGDCIWLFLDKARKVGAELGVGGDKGKREWARVSLDDLMLVRGDVILPHHYDFYYFIFNKVTGFNGPLFSYSAEATKATPSTTESDATEHEYNPLERHDKDKDQSAGIPEEELEGYDEDATMTKVVDRRWYEGNKHIFPASVWEEYTREKDLSKAKRKDTEGNTFFFS